MSLDLRSSKLLDLVDSESQVEQIGTGCLFTEGPLWNAEGNFLLFSDIPADQIKMWTLGSGITTFRQPSGQSNGLTYDKQKRLLACEHANRRVSRTESDGTVTTLASHYEGKKLNSPNDIVVKSDGSIYFTDPPYGLKAEYGEEGGAELDFQGVLGDVPIVGRAWVIQTGRWERLVLLATEPARTGLDEGENRRRLIGFLARRDAQ